MDVFSLAPAASSFSMMSTRPRPAATCSGVRMSDGASFHSSSSVGGVLSEPRRSLALRPRDEGVRTAIDVIRRVPIDKQDDATVRPTDAEGTVVRQSRSPALLAHGSVHVRLCLQQQIDDPVPGRGRVHEDGLMEQRRPIDAGAGLEERCHHPGRDPLRGLALQGRNLQHRPPILDPMLFRVRIRLGAEQLADAGDVPELAGEHQRRPPVVVSLVDRRALVQQPLHLALVPGGDDGAEPAQLQLAHPIGERAERAERVVGHGRRVCRTRPARLLRPWTGGLRWAVCHHVHRLWAVCHHVHRLYHPAYRVDAERITGGRHHGVSIRLAAACPVAVAVHCERRIADLNIEIGVACLLVRLVDIPVAGHQEGSATDFEQATLIAPQHHAHLRVAALLAFRQVVVCTALRSRRIPPRIVDQLRVALGGGTDIRCRQT
eukprot:3478564-Prymnesium_polylepis.2